MNTITLGDIEVNSIGLGTNRITDNAESREILKYAAERVPASKHPPQLPQAFWLKC